MYNLSEPERSVAAKGWPEEGGGDRAGRQQWRSARKGLQCDVGQLLLLPLPAKQQIMWQGHLLAADTFLLQLYGLPASSKHRVALLTKAPPPSTPLLFFLGEEKTRNAHGTDSLIVYTRVHYSFNVNECTQHSNKHPQHTHTHTQAGIH